MEQEQAHKNCRRRLAVSVFLLARWRARISEWQRRIYEELYETNANVSFLLSYTVQLLDIFG